MIRFVCASCGQAFKVKDEFAGRKVRCKTCQTVGVIPKPAAQAVAVSAAKSQSLADLADDDPPGDAGTASLLGELMSAESAASAIPGPPPFQARPNGAAAPIAEKRAPAVVRRAASASGEGGGSGLSTAGLVLGILSVLTWLFPVIGVPISIVGLVLGSMGKRRGGGGAGVVLNIIGLVLNIVIIILWVVAVNVAATHRP